MTWFAGATPACEIFTYQMDARSDTHLERHEASVEAYRMRGIFNEASFFTTSALHLFAAERLAGHERIAP